MSTSANPPGGRPSLIDKLAAVSAFAGGAILTAITLMAVASIIMRSLGFRPIQGDFELVQVALAGCIALMLPWCQLQGGNLTVDFFTVRLQRKKQRRLDAIGAVLFAMIMALVTWRTCAGAIAVKASNESTMILGFPLWIGYVAMIPGLLLTVFAALQTARTAWKESRR
ncbi:MAG TPA: TRAP transporter small permease [Burkholderiales bacterium]